MPRAGLSSKQQVSENVTSDNGREEDLRGVKPAVDVAPRRRFAELGGEIASKLRAPRCRLARTSAQQVGVLARFAYRVSSASPLTAGNTCGCNPRFAVGKIVERRTEKGTKRSLAVKHGYFQPRFAAHLRMRTPYYSGSATPAIRRES
jgi:hypothetical protein